MGTGTEYVGVIGAAARLGVSRMTIWRWIRAGTLVPTLVIGRNAYFDVDTLHAPEAPGARTEAHQRHQARVPRQQPIQQPTEARTGAPARVQPIEAHANSPQYQAHRSVLSTFDPDLD